MNRKSLFLILILFLIFTCSSCNNKNENNGISSGVAPTIDSSPTPTPTIEESVTPTPTPTPTLTPTPTPTIEEDIIDYENSLFASPTGNGDGSFNNPYSLEDGIKNISYKKTLYLMGGTYYPSAVIKLNNSGIKDKYINIYAYKDEKVILDYGYDYTKNPTINGNYNTSKGRGIIVNGSYYHIKGITITRANAHGMVVAGDYNIIENCVFAYNGNSGCSISGSSSETIDEWPHDNLIKNCTSYGNYDWDRSDGNQGEDADGFTAKLTSGYNNVFDGCIAYNNSDDGWDLFTKHKTGKIGSVTIKNSVAFSNGYSVEGVELKNGQGFKLGGRAIEVDHTVTNCVAFYNKSNGFDDNSNPGTITITNCTSYKNGSRNYAMGRFLDKTNTYTSTWYEGDTLFGPIENVPKSHNIYENCISYLGGITDTYSGEAANCYFYNTNNTYVVFNQSSLCNSKYNVGLSIASYNPFVSTEIDLSDLDNIHYNYRNENYTVNLNSFLEIKSNLNIGANLN